MSRRILILGGSGFVGSYLQAELSGAFQVETTSSSGRGATHAFDILRRDHHDLVLRGGYDAIVNCVVRRMGTLAECFEVNVRGLAELASALAASPVHFVQVSTLSATLENRHLGDYGLTKFLADELLAGCSRSGALRTASLRFGQIFDQAGRSAASQPGLHRWVAQLRAREPIEVFAGSSKRAYIPVELVARAIRHAIENQLTGAHDVISPETFTPLELAELLVGQAGLGRDHLRLSTGQTASSYVVPECSPEYRSWFSRQEPVSEHFRRLIQHG
jgi:nucleoside-diphosphate-sugar epimerase